MNDMSRIWRIPTPPPDRSLREAMTRGFIGRCPSCGRGRLFSSYLKVVNACEVCGEEFSGHRADDAPAYITLLIVAHIVGAGVLMSDETWPNWREDRAEKSACVLIVCSSGWFDSYRKKGQRSKDRKSVV